MGNLLFIPFQSAPDVPDTLYRYFGPSHVVGDVPLILDSGDEPLRDQVPDNPSLLAVAAAGLNGLVTVQSDPVLATASYYANIEPASKSLTFSCLIQATAADCSSAFGLWDPATDFEIGLYLAKGLGSIPTGSGPVTDKWALVYRNNAGNYPQITLATPSADVLLLAFSLDYSQGSVEYTVSEDWGPYSSGSFALNLESVQFSSLYSFYWCVINTFANPIELAEMRCRNNLFMNQQAREIELDSYRGVWEP